jgi:hypothetical protein
MADFGISVAAPRNRHRRTSPWIFFAVQLVVLLQFLTPGAAGEDKSDKPKPPDPELVQQLVLQVQELQARVNDLEARLAAAGVPAQPAAAAAGAASPAPSTEAARVPAAPAAPAAQEPDAGSPAGGVKLRMFGDVGYEASDQKAETNSFHIGSVDLLMTGNLSDRVSVLGEVLFTPQSDNSIGVDIERMVLQYKHNDYFTAGVGRYHTSIGYYNTAFHQGAWFQTAVDRPFMYAFDDHGGFLPLQEVGVTASGHLPFEKLGLHYVVEMGNGRAHLLGSDPAQNTQDTNNGKSVNFALSSDPSWVPGLETGFSMYHDYLTFSDNLNHGEGAAGERRDELISTAWVVYNSSKYEFLNEGLLVRHDHTSTGVPGTFHTPDSTHSFPAGLASTVPFSGTRT